MKIVVLFCIFTSDRAGLPAYAAVAIIRHWHVNSIAPRPKIRTVRRYKPVVSLKFISRFFGTREYGKTKMITEIDFRN